MYQSISQEKGRAFAEVKPINVRKLFIPKADSALQQKIENVQYAEKSFKHPQKEIKSIAQMNAEI